MSTRLTQYIFTPTYRSTHTHRYEHGESLTYDRCRNKNVHTYADTQRMHTINTHVYTYT